MQPYAHGYAASRYTSPPASPPQKQYPAAHSTSSAFSASANPNEDWTKISDLAERRRIQNRIAQRNYRKKLKKRLEDLERRAGSSSTSPEQQHAELSQPDTTSSWYSAQPVSPPQRTNSSQSHRTRTPEVLAQQYVLPTDDRTMFSEQFTRQLSTSPPPFSCASVSTIDSSDYSSYPPRQPYCTFTGSGMDLPIYPQYHGLPTGYTMHTDTSPPIKQEFYGDDDINPFNVSYAAINEMPSFAELPSHMRPHLPYSRTEAFPMHRS